jgi:hypothetical protein
MGHARLPRVVRLLHQASSSDRAGAGSRGGQVQPRTPLGSVILRVTPTATSSSPGSSPNRWAVSQSFCWSFHHAPLRRTGRYQPDGTLDLTWEDGTGRGATDVWEATHNRPHADVGSAL